MARLQGRIVINPKVLTDNRDALAIAYNEAYRMVMEANNFEPMAEPTEEQLQFFADTAYANDPLQLKRTITARIATYDDSVPNPTPEQYQDVVNMLEMVKQAGVIQNKEEEDVVTSTLEDMTEKAGQLEQLQPAEQGTMEEGATPEGAMPQAAMPEGAMPPEGDVPAEGGEPQGLDPAMLQQMMGGGNEQLMAQAADKGGSVLPEDEELDAAYAKATDNATQAGSTGGNAGVVNGLLESQPGALEAIKAQGDKLDKEFNETVESQRKGLIKVNGVWRKPAKSAYLGAEDPNGTMTMTEEGRNEALALGYMNSDKAVINDEVYKAAKTEQDKLKADFKGGEKYGHYFTDETGNVTKESFRNGVARINDELARLDDIEKETESKIGGFSPEEYEAKKAEIAGLRDSLKKAQSAANRATELSGIMKGREEAIADQYRNMSKEELLARAEEQRQQNIAARNKTRTDAANKQLSALKKQWDELDAKKQAMILEGENTDAIEARMAELEGRRDAIKGRAQFRNDLHKNIRSMAVKAAGGDFSILDYASPALKNTMSLATVDRINSIMNGSNNTSLRNASNPYYRNLQRIAAKYGNANMTASGDWVRQVKGEDQWS